MPAHIASTSSPRPARRLLHSSAFSLRQHKAPPCAAPQLHSPTLRSGVSYTTLVFAVAVSVSAGIAFSRLSRKHTADHSTDIEAQYKDTVETKLHPTLFTMTTQTPPGRPGNLTAEQEVKLREFWGVVLKTFGVIDEQQLKNLPNGTTSSARTSTDTPASPTAKKHKSRLSMFRSKDKDEDADGGDSVNDKHGLSQAYKDALAANTPEELRQAFWSMVKHDHPDGLLLRFLRARKWDVNAALVMMISTMHWRLKEMKVDSDIMYNGEGGELINSKSSDPAKKKEGEDFISQMRMGKSFLHGVDKEGRPLCHVRVRLHKQGEQSEASLERFTVYTIETARMLLRPPVDTATIIFDMTGFTLANMDYTPVKFMIKCFEANYPECLGAILVHKAPWVFNAIWNVIKGWLDPVVAGKVHFTKNVDELAQFIDRSHIIKELEGSDEWEYQYVEPVDGENGMMSRTEDRERVGAVRKELAKKFEEKTISWIQSGEKSTLDERNKLADEFSANSWQMDPYVRARSLYDRTGVIGKDGAVNIYPPKMAPQEALQQQGTLGKSTDDGGVD